MKKFLKKNKFYLLSIFIIFIIILSFVYNVSAYTYESIDFNYGKVNTKSTLNIRCGPGINYNRVGKLNNSEYVDVFAKVGDWYIIQTDENLVGAVSSKYIEPIYNESEVLDYRENKNLKEEQTTLTSTEVGDNGEYVDNLELTDEENEFLKLINSNRKNNGLEELKIDSAVQNVARLKAEDLEKNDYFSHFSPTYGNIDSMLQSFGINFASVQENIAGNQNLSGAVEAWMNSDSHKSNILNSEFNYTGVAIAKSKTYGNIFVEVFIKK